MKTVNLIGAGRLGTTLAHCLLSRNLIQLKGICNSSLQSAHSVVLELGTGTACAQISALPAAEWYIITCPDDAISDIVPQLMSQAFTKKTVFMHCSGALSSDILKPLADKGAYVASLHPLRAFTGELNINAFQDCHCSLEGDAVACQIIQAIFSDLGAEIFSLQTTKKSQYHAAAVMASNYLVTLAECSQILFQDAEIPAQTARHITQDLLRHSLSNLLLKNSNKNALTGPLQRGDTHCIERHLTALEKFPKIQSLYRSAALNTLAITENSPERQQVLKELLERLSFSEDV